MSIKILAVSTEANHGGAAIAAYRLHKGLISIGTKSQMLVRRKNTDDYTVTSSETKFDIVRSSVASFFDKIPAKFYTKRDDTTFSSAILGHCDIIRQIQLFDPDIVHLHWIVNGFITIEIMRKINKPIIWTIHDMWAFTGGCHYAFDCDRYQNTCGCCPLLTSNTRFDLSHLNMVRKMNAWKNLDITVVSPSRWLAECAGKSSLFKNRNIEVIPNGFDLEVFKPVPKSTAREILSLANNKKIILVGADNLLNNTRKGIHYLKQALDELSHMTSKDDIELVVFGCSEPEVNPDYGFETRFIGRLYDSYSLALVYSAADILVVPSIQDNLPNTAIESMACGTPVVSFDIGGMSDIVLHEQTGYLAEPFISYELAKGIFWIINDSEILERLSLNSRKYVEKMFKLDSIANKYKRLYIATAQRHHPLNFTALPPKHLQG